MSKLTSIIFILLITNCAVLQAQEISGIGRFKINRTRVDVIDSLTKELKTKLIHVKDYLDLIERKDKEKYRKVAVFEIPPNLEPFATSPAGSDARFFYMREYTISGIKLEEVYLKFFNGVLMSIESDSSTELRDAFKIKYGEPIAERKEENDDCDNGGVDITLPGWIMTDTWKSGDISAKITTGKSFKHSDCSVYYYGGVTVASTILTEQYKNYADSVTQKNEAKTISEKAKALKDF